MNLILTCIDSFSFFYLNGINWVIVELSSLLCRRAYHSLAKILKYPDLTDAQDLCTINKQDKLWDVSKEKLRL